MRAAARIRAVLVPRARPVSSASFSLLTPTRAKRPPSALADDAPGWNEDLATVSEASVKADRVAATTIKDMQQKTVDHVQPRRTDDPDLKQTHAAYARDEVSGPLGSTGVGEFEGVVGKDDLGPEDAQVESDGRVLTRRIVRDKNAAHGDEPSAA